MPSEWNTPTKIYVRWCQLKNNNNDKIIWLYWSSVFTCKSGFRLACCLLLPALPRDHCLPFQSCSSQQPHRFAFPSSGTLAALSSSIEFNCLRSAALGKVVRLSIGWQDAAYRLVFPLLQVALAQLYKYHHRNGKLQASLKAALGSAALMPPVNRILTNTSYLLSVAA